MMSSFWAASAARDSSCAVSRDLVQSCVHPVQCCCDVPQFVVVILPVLFVELLEEFPFGLMHLLSHLECFRRSGMTSSASRSFSVVCAHGVVRLQTLTVLVNLVHPSMVMLHCNHLVVELVAMIRSLSLFSCTSSVSCLVLLSSCWTLMSFSSDTPSD